MKKMIFTLVALMTTFVSVNAMTYNQARDEALFLTDKMAYELNFNEQQYEAAYEINLDYLMSINTVDDVYADSWRYRNLDMQYILNDWQYTAFCAASYFFRPVYWERGYWHFGIYAHYPHRTHFFFTRPACYVSYRGGHGWHYNGGRSWYQSRVHTYRGHVNHVGMRDSYNRGNYNRGIYNRGGAIQHNGNNSYRNNNSVNRNNSINRGNGSYINRGSSAVNRNRDVNTNRGNSSVNPGSTIKRGDYNNNSTMRQEQRRSSTRTTVERNSAPRPSVSAPTSPSYSGSRSMAGTISRGNNSFSNRGNNGSVNRGGGFNNVSRGSSNIGSVNHGGGNHGGGHGGGRR